MYELKHVTRHGFPVHMDTPHTDTLHIRSARVYSHMDTYELISHSHTVAQMPPDTQTYSEA